MTQDLASRLNLLAARSLPRGFVYDINRVAPRVYEEAYSRAFNDPGWGEAEGCDIRGHLCRSLFEKQFRDIAVKYGLKVVQKKNHRQTASYTIVMAEGLLLTSSAVQNEWDMSRNAHFRGRMAKLNSQMLQPALPTMTTDLDEALSDKPVYAVVCHGPMWSRAKSIEFLHLTFPDEAQQKVLHRVSIADLLKLQTAHPHQKQEEDRAIPRLKRRQKTGDE